MKKILYWLLAIALVAAVSPRGWAEKGGRGQGKKGGSEAAAHGKKADSRASAERSNKGGETRGLDRASEVQEMNPTGAGGQGLDKSHEHASGAADEAGKGKSKASSKKAHKQKKAEAAKSEAVPPQQ